MIATYNDRKDSLMLEATLKAKVEPNEMFADGDTSNSGFDLIDDLNNMEIVLFNKKEPVSFGGTYGGDDEEKAAAAEPVGAASSPVNTGNLPVDLASDGGAGQADKAGGSLPAAGDQPVQKSPFDSVKENKSKTFVGSMNPSQCFSGDNIDNALDDFAEAAATNTKLKFPAPKKAASAADGISASAASDAGDIADLGFPIVSPPASSGATPLAAPKGDYSAPALCDEIICISIEFIMKPVKAYFSKTDNCIQCHVQYINEGMQKTLSHSLIPAKASGNLVESGLCKKAAGTALGKIGMNVIFTTVPVITPAKDDLVTFGNISDEWSSYASKNGAWNYGEKERRRLAAQKTSQPVDTSAIPDSIENQLLIEINNAGDNATQADILDRARTADDKTKAQEAQEQLVAEISKDAFGQVSTINTLDTEMKSMTMFFDSIQKNIRTLLEDVPGLTSTKACVKLDETKVCT